MPTSPARQRARTARCLSRDSLEGHGLALLGVPAAPGLHERQTWPPGSAAGSIPADLDRWLLERGFGRDVSVVVIGIDHHIDPQIRQCRQKRCRNGDGLLRRSW
jgi:hypothetical protein